MASSLTRKPVSQESCGPQNARQVNVALARSSGTYLRYRDKLAKPDVLILDDIGVRKLSSTEAQDLCEILEERSIGKSTMFTTQLPLDHGSEVIADPVIADAIRDRLEHVFREDARLGAVCTVHRWRASADLRTPALRARALNSVLRPVQNRQVAPVRRRIVPDRRMPAHGN
jgi:hypothetical protein